jgi:hypothetical protein
MSCSFVDWGRVQTVSIFLRPHGLNHSFLDVMSTPPMPLWTFSPRLTGIETDLDVTSPVCPFSGIKLTGRVVGDRGLQKRGLSTKSRSISTGFRYNDSV